MTERTGTALKELQKLDTRIQEAKDRIREFEPLLADVEEPALVLESEAETTRSRLKEMRLEERRMELAAEEKRQRVERLEERLNTVRNVREEAAVRAELEMVKQAMEGDDQETYTLLDQIKKLETRLQEQEEALAEARAEVEPRRQELLSERESVTSEVERLQTERDSFVGGLEDRELRIYEGIRGRTGRRAVAPLTADGACGHCFSMIPLQLQNEIRNEAPLIRCEACGVILTPPEPEAEEAPGAEAGPGAAETGAGTDPEAGEGAGAGAEPSAEAAGADDGADGAEGSGSAEDAEEATGERVEA